MPRLLPGLLALLVAFLASVLLMDGLPDRVPTHWGLDGTPDGYSSPTVVVFLMPVFGLLMAAVLGVIPRVDPRRDAYTTPGSPYWIVANAVLAFLAILQLALVGFALGWPIRMGTLVPVLVGGLFVILGGLMERMPPSWFMGIRTPWTLSDDEVWRKTHRVGGVCFILAGLVLMIGGFVKPEGLLITLIVVAGLAAGVPVAYSWILWRAREERGVRG